MMTNKKAGLPVLVLLAAVIMTGCAQEAEQDQGQVQETQPEAGVLTVSDAEDGVFYAADVYEYAEAVSADDFNGIISGAELAGVGLGTADNGTLEIDLQTPDGEDFTSDGDFLVVLTSTDKDSSAPLKYKAAVTFANGSAALKYSTMKTAAVEPGDENVPVYTVTFDLNYTDAPNPPRNQKIKEGGKVTPPAAPTREYYTLDGWYTSKDCTMKWDFDTHTVTADIGLYAKWLDDSITYRTVTFHTNGGIPADFTQTAEDGDKITLPDPAPTRDGHTFDGWYTAADYAAKWDFDTRTVTTDLDLYAKWTRNAYKVTFNTGDAEHTPAPLENVLYDDKIAAPAITKTGHTLDGWYISTAYTTKWDFALNTVKENMMLYGTWVPIAYAVTFDLNYTGAPAPPVSPPIAYGSTITRPDPAPTREGYTLGGWYRNADGTGAAWNFDTDTVTGDIALYAKWTQNNCAVTFSLNRAPGTAPAPQAVPYGGTITRPDPAPQWIGCTLGGWFLDTDGTGAAWNFDTDTVTEDTTLYAKWTQNTYTVTFYLNYTGTPGTSPAPQAVLHGGKITEPPAPQRTGCIFGGWYRNAAGTGAEWDFDLNTVTTDIDLYAKWKYTVTFNTGEGGSSVPALEVPHGSAATRPGTNPTRAGGYAFDNWYAANADTPYNFSSPVTVNITLYAKWNPITLAAVIAEMAADAAANTPKTYTLPIGVDTYNAALTLTTANSPAQVTIDGSGRAVTGNANRFTIGSGVTITLKNITFTKIPFTAAAGGKLVLDNGAVVTGNAGTGVTVTGTSATAKGTLEMKTGSSVTGNGDSGVKLEGTGVFTMSGGTISGNEADNGGGVEMKGTGGTFTMTGGTISGNEAIEYGGGVSMMGTNGVFTMSGGTISGNEAYDIGGGVYMIGGAFMMSGSGKISGNKSVTTGGGGAGVFMDGGTFTMSGGEISGNNASNGGGVTLWEHTNATFNMSGGVIKNNTAAHDGGGVFAMTATTFNMTGGEVTINHAPVGGGLYLSGNLTGNPSIGSKVNGKGSIYGNTPKDLRD